MSFSDDIKKAVNEPRKLTRYLRSLARTIPFRLRLNRLIPKSLYLQYTPDRYSILLDRYKEKAEVRFHDSSRLGKWTRHNYHGNAGDMTRYFFLTLACEQIVKEGLVGDIAEIGVYKGNSATILVHLARALGTTAYLFDTYEGFAGRDLVGVDSDVRRDAFSDNSLEFVKKVVGDESVQFVKGHFPGSLSQISTSLRFCLVHIDCDLYAPFKDALEYFYPLLVDGGMLIMHDYSSYSWDGVEKAVDEFFRDKPERLILIPDRSGTAVIRKAGKFSV